LYVEKAGLTIPYLNVDYELSDRSVIDLVGQNSCLEIIHWLIQNLNKGTLNGNIEHNNFGIGN
jgi:hypothetical protein